MYHAVVFIDCTGDGDMAAKAGAPFHIGGEAGELQSATLCFVLTNVNPSTFCVEKMNGAHPESPIHKILALKDKYPLITDEHLCIDLLWTGTVSFNAGHLWESDGTDIWCGDDNWQSNFGMLWQRWTPKRSEKPIC